MQLSVSVIKCMRNEGECEWGLGLGLTWLLLDMNYECGERYRKS